MKNKAKHIHKEAMGDVNVFRLVVTAFFSLLVVAIICFFVFSFTKDTMCTLAANVYAQNSEYSLSLSEDSDSDVETTTNFQDSLDLESELVPSSDVLTDEETNELNVDATDNTILLEDTTFNYDVDIQYDSRIYHIKSGDTLSKISLETGVSVQELAKINAIDDVNLIYADSALQIPVK